MFGCCRKGCDQRNAGSVFVFRFASVSLFALRISLLMRTKRSTMSPEPFGSSSLTTFSMNLSSICRSRTRYFGCSLFGKLITICPCASSPPGPMAYTAGTVFRGMFHANANRENWPGLPPGIGQPRKLSSPTRTPEAVGEPETLYVTKSAMPR